MNKKNNRLRKSSQKKIEQAFIDLLQTNSIADIKITDLCIAADVNRATFYNNYADVFELAQKVRNNIAKEFFGDLHKDDHIVVDIDSFAFMLNYIKSHRKEYNAYYTLNSNNCNDEISTAIREKYVEYYHDEAVANYQITFFKAGTDALTKAWINADCVTPVYELASMIISNYLPHKK